MLCLSLGKWGGPLKRLMAVVYSMDPMHPVFGHQNSMVVELSKSFEISVVSLHDKGNAYRDINGISVYPINWQSNNKIRNIFKLYQVLFAIVLRHKPTIVFCHMTEVASAIYGPVLFVMCIPQVLWYAHTSLSPGLRISKFFATKIISSTPGSIPISGKKIEYLGQMVDHRIFINEDFRVPPSSGVIRAIHVGRLDPSKRIDLLCEIFQFDILKHRDIYLDFIGGPTRKNIEYAKLIKFRFEGHRNAVRIRFLGTQDKFSIRNHLKNSHIFVHAFSGSLDKVLIEATLMGLPVITCNSEYHKEFGFWSKHNISPNPSYIIAAE
jgi:glycosyltransferase involved in cell wall biosynthesis